MTAPRIGPTGNLDERVRGRVDAANELLAQSHAVAQQAAVRVAWMAQRTFNRLQAGLRALVEQAIAHLTNAWAPVVPLALNARASPRRSAAGCSPSDGQWRGMGEIPRDQDGC